MAPGQPAPPSPARLVLTLAPGLSAAGAWLSAAATAWSRWNALALGPICGQPDGVMGLAGHCPACPLAVTLTAAFALALAWTRREGGKALVAAA